MTYVTNPDSVDYPFPVVYSTESGGYRRATVAEIGDQVRAQARVTRDLAGWQVDNTPDKLDKWWAQRQEFVSMISRSPYGRKYTVRGRHHTRTRAAAVDTLLAVVPAGYGHRDGVIEW